MQQVYQMKTYRARIFSLKVFLPSEIVLTSQQLSSLWKAKCSLLLCLDLTRPNNEIVEYDLKLTAANLKFHISEAQVATVISYGTCREGGKLEILPYARNFKELKTIQN